MRLFRANQAQQSEADRARDLRLTYIASRYRAERKLASEGEASLELPLEPPPEGTQPSEGEQ